MEILYSKVDRTNEICETCLEKESNKQISRRPITQRYGPFRRLFFDVVKARYFAHFYLDGIRFHVVYIMESLHQMKGIFLIAIRFIERWLNLKILVVFSDNKTSIDRETEA
ncbi:hypothetical protein N7470_002623 [Penicillium chermesinum]|nr:hypothetical protein N7470_002623 [Penicillium chermesinum]